MKINERIIKISERKKVDFLGFIQFLFNERKMKRIGLFLCLIIAITSILSAQNVIDAKKVSKHLLLSQQGQNSVNLSSLPNGVYAVQLITDSKNTTGSP